jgi:hypothetical protein
LEDRSLVISVTRLGESTWLEHALFWQDYSAWSSGYLPRATVY